MIGIIGISHKTSPLETREQFSVSKEEILPFAELLQNEAGISDIVVLSTCNRTEIYFNQSKHEPHHAAKLVYKTLKQFKKIEGNHWDFFYSYSDLEAVRHLFEVASGMDSMVIGEDQIVGQIKEAYVYCTEEALTDAVLMRLFQKSFEASKKVRTKTKIKLGTTSVSAAAVQKCSILFPDFSHKRVLLIGAGETGSLVLQSLNKSGVKRITVTNRTEEKAEKLAIRHGCTPLPFEQMPPHLYLYDIIIIATGSQIPLVTKNMVEESLQKRENQQQVYIDISVPRNIEEKVEDLEPVQLYTIDDLQEIVNASMAMRKGSIEEGNQIINEIVEEFGEWLSSRSLRPAIKAIKYNMLKVTKDELSAYNNSDSKEVQTAINDFSKHLTEKHIRLLIKNLKDITANGKNGEALNIVNDLFNMGEE